MFVFSNCNGIHATDRLDPKLCSVLQLRTRVIDLNEFIFGEFSAQFVAQLLRTHREHDTRVTEEGHARAGGCAVRKC
jgi:hypothetical protein